MPKETIDSRFVGEVLTDPRDGSQVHTECTYLHVGWTKERDHVEMAVRAHVHGPDSPGYQAEVPPGTGDGLFVQLDRAGINRAIRALRTARDQAYGRDE